ncbi:MAG: hypothetical protein ACI38A_04945 [Candidatus Ornithomonoglobus sp.]
MSEKEKKEVPRNVIVTYGINGLSLVDCMKNIIINKKLLDKI